MKFSPEEFLDEMKALKEEYPRSPEHFHRHADELICDLLVELGYKDGVEFFQKEKKWYV
jgi:hypothetical protein